MDEASFWADRTAELEEYARLALRVGVNLEQGQDVTLVSYVEHAPLVRAIARVAYEEGARRVDPLYLDVHVRRAKAELAPDDAVGWVPRWLLQRVEEEAERRTAMINTVGEPDPDLFAGIDADRINQSLMPDLRRAVWDALRPRPDALDDRRVPDGRLGASRCSASPTSSGSGRRSARPFAWTSPIRSQPGRRTSRCSRSARGS